MPQFLQASTILWAVTGTSEHLLRTRCDPCHRHRYIGASHGFPGPSWRPSRPILGDLLSTQRLQVKEVHCCFSALWAYSGCSSHSAFSSAEWRGRLHLKAEAVTRAVHRLHLVAVFSYTFAVCLLFGFAFRRALYVMRGEFPDLIL